IGKGAGRGKEEKSGGGRFFKKKKKRGGEAEAGSGLGSDEWKREGKGRRSRDVETSESASMEGGRHAGAGGRRWRSTENRRECRRGVSERVCALLVQTPVISGAPPAVSVTIARVLSVLRAASTCRRRRASIFARCWFFFFFKQKTAYEIGQ